jgi:dTDP-4-amino-4,6-dideoxygalactose transaminase
MYYLLLADLEVRTALMAHLKAQGIFAVFHYVPLHSSPAGQRFGRASGTLPVTCDLSDRLLRLPLWVGLDQEGAQERVINCVQEFFARV